MSGTVKTVLLVGGVAVGVVVLFKVLSPVRALPTPAKKQTGLTDLISVNSLISLGSKIFGGNSDGSQVTGYTSHGPTAAEVAASGIDTTNYTTTNGFMFTDASGNFIAG